MFVHFFLEDQFMGFEGSASSGSAHQTSSMAFAPPSGSADEVDGLGSFVSSIDSANTSDHKCRLCVGVL